MFQVATRVLDVSEMFVGFPIVWPEIENLTSFQRMVAVYTMPLQEELLRVLRPTAMGRALPLDSILFKMLSLVPREVDQAVPVGVTMLFTIELFIIGEVTL